MKDWPKYQCGYVSSNGKFFKEREEAESYETEQQFTACYSSKHNRLWINGNSVPAEDVRHWLCGIDVDMAMTMITLLQEYITGLENRVFEADPFEEDPKI